MQDPQGLVEAMGGRDAFVKKLDGLFEQPETVDGAGCVVDVTGLIGQYVHGNEPSHHVIYFYTLAGEPDRAARRIRDVFDRFYKPKADGLCGNDDCGQMSAWYIFSALGFYPFNPCGGTYVLGAPQIPKATIELAGGKALTVVARNLSAENKYVKTVAFNGRPLDKTIEHADLMSGGELVFEMTNAARR
jgi:predicted alpha-1,2-mannosidase